MTTRLFATLRRDVLLQARHGFYAVSVFVVIVFGVVLSLLPEGAGAVAAIVPAFLVFNLLVTTFYFMAGLVLLEKGEGMLAAVVTTPLRDVEYLASKVATLVALALVESFVVLGIAFGGSIRWGLLLAGGALLGVLYAAVGFASVARYDAINRWLMPSAALVTLLLLPLLGHFELLPRYFFLWHPVEPAFVLMRAACAPASTWQVAYGLAGGLLWAGLAPAWARARFRRFVVR